MTDTTYALDALSGLGEIGADFAAEIGRSDAQPALETMMSVESDILNDMGGSAADVSSAFDGLPSNVQGAIYKEIASAYVRNDGGLADVDARNHLC